MHSHTPSRTKPLVSGQSIYQRTTMAKGVGYRLLWVAIVLAALWLAIIWAIAIP